MFDPRYKIYMYATLIMITILLCMEVAWGCVDCDLNKKSVKDAQVTEIEWHNADGTVQRSTKVVDGSQKILYDNVKTVKNDADQYCYIKVIIKQSANGDISKEEKLYCSDGRSGVSDTPSYWELFAQFYYRDVATPEYCRHYSRKSHAFKSFGKVCLNKDGEWKVK
tara:strand:+ start:1684 stop:2181 length:498 start_codon:yes stop_codon:yes gene_type:complete